MNRHLIYFTQRVATAAASSLVYALVDKYSSPPKYNGYKKQYTNKNKSNQQRSSYTKRDNYEQRSNQRSSYRSRTYSENKGRPRYSMGEQMERRKD